MLNMKRFSVTASVLAVVLFAVTSCSQVTINADSPGQVNEDFRLDEPIKASLCQVQNNPAAYNHKLIEITGFVSHGFEDSSVFDPECSSQQGIWVEYGGTGGAGTMYCCGVTAERKRSEPLVVEDIPTSLVDDEQFRTFDKQLQRPTDSIVRATVVGRFFAGQKSKYSKDDLFGGYGHFGCCSLFVVQKVVTVELQNRNDLDYRASADQPDLDSGKVNGYKILRSDESQIELQRKAEAGQTEWVFSDPQRVASETLAKLTGVDKKSIQGIRRTSQSQGRFIYRWKNKETKTSYMVVVSRPYWLSFYAKDAKRVAWVAIATYELT
jgi:hypothetical protein